MNDSRQQTTIANAKALTLGKLRALMGNSQP